MLKVFICFFSFLGKYCYFCMIMKRYDFDKRIERRGSGDIKFDDLGSRFGRSDLYALWVADMDFEVAPEIKRAIEERVGKGVYGYAKVSDSYWDAVTDWINGHFHVSAKRDELSFIPGIVRGIAFVINYFTERGDKVLIQPPVYHPFRLVTEGNGRIVVNNPLKLDSEGHYHMDLDDLERVVSGERPKVMILCNPHNPGGIRWSVVELKGAARIADRYGMIVVSDEIHADLILSGERHNCFIGVSDEAARVGLVFGAPSKTFNIPGLVSSWVMIKNPELRKGFFEWLSVNEFNDAPFTATVPTEAAYRHGEPWLKELIGYLNDNIDFVAAFLGEHVPEIKVIRPEASFLVWLDCRGLNMTQPELVDFFVNKAHLALNDGSMFGAEGEGFMRLNVATSRDYLSEALDSLRTAYERL